MGSCGSKPGEAGTLASKGTAGSAVPIDSALAKKIEAVRTSAQALTTPQKAARASRDSSAPEVGMRGKHNPERGEGLSLIHI